MFREMRRKRQQLSDEECLAVLGNRYWPDHDVELSAEIAGKLDRMAILAFDMEHIAGKQARELM